MSKFPKCCRRHFSAYLSWLARRNRCCCLKAWVGHLFCLLVAVFLVVRRRHGVVALPSCRRAYLRRLCLVVRLPSSPGLGSAPTLLTVAAASGPHEAASLCAGLARQSWKMSLTRANVGSGHVFTTSLGWPAAPSPRELLIPWGPGGSGAPGPATWAHGAPDLASRRRRAPCQ